MERFILCLEVGISENPGSLHSALSLNCTFQLFPSYSHLLEGPVNIKLEKEQLQNGGGDHQSYFVLLLR